MFKHLHGPAAVWLALGLLAVAGVSGNATDAYAQNYQPLHSIRLESCSDEYKQVTQYKILEVTCDYQVNGQQAAVTLKSDLRNYIPASTAPHWKAQVWILDDSNDSFAEENAYLFNYTQNKGENSNAYVDGEKILKVRIEGQVPRAYHHTDPHEDPLGQKYRHETPRPTEFNIMQVSLGRAANTKTAQPVTATAVAEEWREVNSLYDDFLAETDTPEKQVAEAGRKLLDEGYIDIAKDLLQTAQDVQASNSDNGGKSKAGWYISGGIGAAVIVIAAIVVVIIFMVNREGGDTGSRSRGAVSNPHGGPNRPSGAPPRR